MFLDIRLVASTVFYIYGLDISLEDNRPWTKL
jgi:hypothetical protein